METGAGLGGPSAGLVLLAPLLVLVAAAIKLTSRGPILVRQRRSGLGGQEFTMLKFRSMTIDAEARKQDLLSQNEQDGPAFKIKNDPRITGVGRFLRKTSIDELPQLWNVLRGDMSLVGPRPLPLRRVRPHVAAGSAAGWMLPRPDLPLAGSRQI